MIPKVIHYCWFGGNPLPPIALKCIESWKKYCPDYDIFEWNESNFDINCSAYVKEAYDAKKWAFVSDYVRFKVLYEYGGVYFDTDVELIRTIDDIIEKGPFMGCEVSSCNMDATSCKHSINPGLGMSSQANNSMYKIILDEYEKRHFLKSDGSLDQLTVVDFITNIFETHGYAYTEKVQVVSDIYIYPSDYFCPINYITGEIAITDNTRSIHHYTASWHTEKEKKWFEIERKLRNKYGNQKTERIIRSILWRISGRLYKTGLKGTIAAFLKKLN